MYSKIIDRGWKNQCGRSQKKVLFGQSHRQSGPRRFLWRGAWFFVLAFQDDDIVIGVYCCQSLWWCSCRCGCGRGWIIWAFSVHLIVLFFQSIFKFSSHIQYLNDEWEWMNFQFSSNFCINSWKFRRCLYTDPHCIEASLVRKSPTLSHHQQDRPSLQRTEFIADGSLWTLETSVGTSQHCGRNSFFCWMVQRTGIFSSEFLF